MAQIVFTLLVSLIFVPCFGTVEVVGRSEMALKSHFKFFHDTSGKLSLAEIRAKTFSDKPLGGFFKGHVWAKTRLCYYGEEDLYFIYKDPIEAIDIYVGESITPLSHRFLGSSELASHFWSKLKIPLQGCEVLLVMFKSGDVMNMAASVMSSSALKTAEIKYIVFYAIYYSFLAIIFLISLFFLFKFKTSLYFYFCCLIVTQDILGASLLNGFMFRFVLSPENFIKYDLGNIFAPLMNASLVAFAVSFLGEKFRINTILSKLFIGSQLLIVVPLLLNVFIPFHEQNPLLSQLVNQSILFSCFWVLFLAMCNFDSQRSKLFLAASGFKVVGQFIKTLLLQGDVSEHVGLFSVNLSFFIFNIAALGSLIEAVSIVGLLIASYFKDLENKNLTLKEMMNELKKSRVDSVVAKISRQVAHDIRSPLTALDMALHDVSQFPEEKRVLIRKASQRINDIANNLLAQSREPISNSGPSEECNSRTSVLLISSIVDPIVSEKRMQFRSKMDIEIDSVIGPESYGLFAEVNSTELSRILSNLINNSVEALSDKGRVSIGLAKCGLDRLRLYVKDNGCGMTPEVVEKVGTKGFSLGKTTGTSGAGLGVYHARTTVESWGGRLDIKSRSGIGTQFSLILPLANPPKWFVPQLEIEHGGRVVILDDDASIHQTWQERFKERNNERFVELVHVLTPEELSHWVRYYGKTGVLFLCDYELLESSKTGLDIIMELEIEHQSILVTSRFSEKAILKQCNELGVRCLPKELARIVPVKIVEQRKKIDIVLIDDDELVHMTWKTAARNARKKLKAYHRPEDFLEDAHDISLETPVYIDSDLGEGVRGESFAETFHAQGFKQIYLCTGFEPSSLRKGQFITSIVGKEPLCF